jgi:AcrR family transcriptional regulator
VTALSAPGSARRRRPTRGDLKEEAILETAGRLLSEKPLHDISVDELAKGAGLSRPTFYFYFQSKHAVLQTLAERVVQLTYEQAERWLARTDEPPAEAIRRSLAAAALHWREHGPVLRAAAETLGSPGTGGFWEGINAGFIEATARQIEREREAGLAPPGPPAAKALATALIWMNERCFYTASVGASPSLDGDELVETLTAVWLHSVYGVGPGPTGIARQQT